MNSFCILSSLVTQQCVVLTAYFEMNIQMTTLINHTLHVIIEDILLEKFIISPRFVRLEDFLYDKIFSNVATHLDAGND